MVQIVSLIIFVQISTIIVISTRKVDKVFLVPLLVALAIASVIIFKMGVDIGAAM